MQWDFKFVFISKERGTGVGVLVPRYESIASGPQLKFEHDIYDMYDRLMILPHPIPDFDMSTCWFLSSSFEKSHHTIQTSQICWPTMSDQFIQLDRYELYWWIWFYFHISTRNSNVQCKENWPSILPPCAATVQKGCNGFSVYIIMLYGDLLTSHNLDLVSTLLTTVG